MRFFFKDYRTVFNNVCGGVMSWIDKVKQALSKKFKPRKWDLTINLFSWKYHKVSVPEPFKSTHYYRGPFFLRVWEDPRKANKLPIRLSI